MTSQFPPAPFGHAQEVTWDDLRRWAPYVTDAMWGRLADRFGTADAVFAATVEDLGSVPYFGESRARRFYMSLHNETPPDRDGNTVVWVLVDPPAPDGELLWPHVTTASGALLVDGDIELPDGRRLPLPLSCDPHRCDGDGPSRNRHGSAPMFDAGCRCGPCCDRFLPAAIAVARRCAGDTLESIGGDMGLTRERVRQITQWADPAMSWEAAKSRRVAATQARERADRQQECPTCGTTFRRSYGRRFCSAEHRDMWATLRYHLDDDRRQSQRERTAAWVTKNRTGDTPATRHAAKVIAGEVTEVESHWLVEGSGTWEVAATAYTSGWPLFDALPDRIQQQVRDHFGAGDGNAGQ